MLTKLWVKLTDSWDTERIRRKLDPVFWIKTLSLRLKMLNSDLETPAFFGDFLDTGSVLYVLL